ncbi:hypothetical protein Tco_1508752 [Tanacetum coccineum]
MIPLYGDVDLTTSEFIHVEAECSASPIFTGNDICPVGHMTSPPKPMRGVVAETIWFFTFGRSLFKQCSYSIFEDDPPSTYIRCMKWPHISASMIIGPSIPSSSPKGGNKIYGFGEKLCVILCLATFYHGVVIGGRVLNLPLSRARISLGDFVRRMNLSRLRSDLCWFWKSPILSKLCFLLASCCFHTGSAFFRTFNELRVGDSVHESGDSHAL